MATATTMGQASDRNSIPAMETTVPRIFESVGPGSVGSGFWEYYNVDARNATINPQGSLLRLMSRINEFLQPSGRVLSVGCGYGLNEILLGCLRPELEIVGVDILDDARSDTKIRSMKAIITQVRSDQVTPLLADGGRLPFHEESFDCVLAIDSLSHADYMRGAQDLEQSQGLLLAEMSRAVRPGGRLGVIENSATSPRNVMRKGRTSCHPVNPFYLKSVLEEIGFGDIHTVPYYDLTGKRNLQARCIGAVLKRSNTFGMLLAPFFMLSARKSGQGRSKPKGSATTRSG